MKRSVVEVWLPCTASMNNECQALHSLTSKTASAGRILGVIHKRLETMQASWSWSIKVESKHLVTVTSVLISRAMLLEPNEDVKHPI